MKIRKRKIELNTFLRVQRIHHLSYAVSRYLVANVETFFRYHDEFESTVSQAMFEKDRNRSKTLLTANFLVVNCHPRSNARDFLVVNCMRYVHGRYIFSRV